jgi:hypothetical protein
MTNKTTQTAFAQTLQNCVYFRAAMASNHWNIEKTAKNEAKAYYPFFEMLQTFQEYATECETLKDFKNSERDYKITIVSEFGFYRFVMPVYCRALLPYFVTDANQGQTANQLPEGLQLIETIQIFADDRENMATAAKFVSSDPFRQNMSGVFIGDDNRNNTQICGTDCHVLFAKKTFMQGLQGRYILPLEMVQFIGKQKSEFIEFYKNAEGKPVASCQNSGGEKFLFNLINENYPDFAAIVPKDFSFRLKIANSELQPVVKLLTKVNKAGKINFEATNNELHNYGQKIEMWAQNEAYGTEQTVLTACQFKSGVDLQFSFNGKLLQSVISKFSKNDIIDIRGNESGRPFIIGSEKSNLEFLLMPMVYTEKTELQPA